ncbi:MAG: tetratricopeptide repeat protein [Lysobacterales bacterium]
MSNLLIKIHFPGYGERNLKRNDALGAAYSWYQAGELAISRAACEQILDALPLDLEALRLMAMIHISEGAAHAAADLISRALGASPDGVLAADVNLQLLLARALRDSGHVTGALEVLERCVSQFPDRADVLTQLGVTRHLCGDLPSARDAYLSASRLQPDAASLKANLAAVLLQLGDAEQAAARARQAISLAPGLGGALKVLGSALAQLGQAQEAEGFLQHAVAAQPDSDSWYQLGMVRDEMGMWDASLDAHRQALALDPGFGPALSESLFMARRLCQWDANDDEKQFETLLSTGGKGLKPFSYLSQKDCPKSQQRCARLWAGQIQKNAGLSAPATRTHWRELAGADGKPLNVGFVSSGFHRHPTACLTAEFFEKLDPLKIRSIAFSVGPDDGSALRQRIRSAVGAFHHLQGHSFADIRRCIEREAIDILVDLRGYGGGAVTEVMVSRPAPVQVNWLAYPGTMGTQDFMDYIILDPFIATDEVVAHTDEAAVILPASYQPTDTTRTFSHLKPTRSAANLPDQGMVFASFNNSYKFSPTVFAIWMDILKQVPGSVLWLLAGKAGTSTDANLRRHAGQQGVDPDRLLMMPKLPHRQYLAHLSLADLFLDTLPYNAHTTASDALWAGCPVLSCAGRSFASRVAGSLLHSAGLAELVVNNLADYRELAVGLAADAKRLEVIKRRVMDARASRLFDTGQFCRDMERAFQQMADQARDGQSPAPIDLRQRR